MPGSGSNRTAIVVGAGVIGVCCALHLQRRGIQVTLVDKAAPGEACSFGNSGRIASVLCAPRSQPGFVWGVPGMLANASHPLKISPGHFLKAFPWFWRFVRSGRPEAVERIAAGLFEICSRADGAFDELVSFAGAGDRVRRNGFLYLYEDAGKVAAARKNIAFATDRGLVFNELSGDEAREIEPAVPASIKTAFHQPNEALVIDPLALTNKLVECFLGLGGKLERTEVTGFGDDHRTLSSSSDVAPVLRTASGVLRADSVVLAVGAWSEELGRKLGLNLPIQAERGYHAEIGDPGIELKVPVSFGDRHLAVSPMDGRMRFSSGAQFAPVDEAPDWRRLDQVLKSARHYFPNLRTEGHTRWVGGRPSTPDSLPLIGASQRHPQVYMASGHGMIGLTLAAITGQLIGEAVSGETPATPLAPFSPDRFQ